MEYIDLETAIDLHDWCKEYPSPTTKWWVQVGKKWKLMSKEDFGFNTFPNKYPALTVNQYNKIKNETY